MEAKCSEEKFTTSKGLEHNKLLKVTLWEDILCLQTKSEKVIREILLFMIISFSYEMKKRWKIPKTTF